MDVVIPILRAILALAVVLGLVWIASKRLGNTGLATGKGRNRRTRTASITVVGRQALSPKVGLALVDVGGERLLLGFSEQGVNVLQTLPAPEDEDVSFSDVLRVELDAEALNATGTDEAMAHSGSSGALAGTRLNGSVLAGSILSPGTWRQTLDAVRAGTVRR